MLEPYAYLLVLLFSLAGLTVLDRRFSLAFFADWRRAAITLAGGVAVFVVWDLAGIAGNIFMIGDSRFLSGWQLAPEFPVEEIFFLCLLMYNALLVWRAGERIWPRT
jgi:lycopene cyclase domain-containing protein